MNHETPAQRRTRLIEQYAGQIHAKLIYVGDYSESESVVWAIKLADAVIAATPQGPESTLKDRYLLGQVREHIKTALEWHDESTPAGTKNRLTQILTMLREES